MEELKLPALATAASSGRTFITAYCIRHGVSPTAAENAVLITSELIGNAYLHAGSGTQVNVSFQDRILRVEVSDTSTVQPRLGTEWTDGTAGRGVMIMDALAQRWGVFAHPAGKSIWFELNE